MKNNKSNLNVFIKSLKEIESEFNTVKILNSYENDLQQTEIIKTDESEDFNSGITKGITNINTNHNYTL